MRGELLSIRDLDEPTLAAWRALSAGALEPNPFFEPELAVAAARHLPGGEGDRLLAVRDGDSLLLALPVRARRSYRRVPLGALLAWGHTHSYLDLPLIAPGDPVAAVECALDVASAVGSRWLVLERAPGDGACREAIDAALERRGETAVALTRLQRPVVRRRPQATYLDGRLSAKRRKNLRRQLRRLGETLGPVTVRDLAPEDFEGALDRFLALEQAGWKGEAGTAVADEPDDAAYLRAGMGALARAGRVQAWVLEAGETTVAVLLAVVGGGAAFHFKTAYDEAHARLSPGTQLEVAVLDAFHTDPALGWIDSCTASEDTPSGLLYPDRRPIEALIVPLGGGPARIGARGLRAALRLRRRGQRDSGTAI